MANPCIKCGDCQVVCPVQLKPQFLHAAIQANHWSRVEALDLEACLFCNACTVACPAEIKLNDEFRTGAKDLQHHLDQQRKSQLAQKRFEAKESRLARKLRLQESQREAKLVKISLEDRKAAIAAALARTQGKYQDG